MSQEFQPGDITYHKATLDRCVVIKLNNDGTIKVRNEKNEEHDYSPVELKKDEPGAVIASFPEDDGSQY